MNANPAQLRVMRVVRWRDLTPRMRRITLACGEDLTPFTRGGLHARVLFPGEGEPVWPGVTTDGRPQWKPGGRKMATRAYTLRHIRVAAGEVDLDFVMHGDEGLASGWAARVRVGDALGVMAPIGRTIPPAAWYVFAGDETAIPPMSRILESLPRDARGVALIEAPDASERQAIDAPEGIEVRWLYRDGQHAGHATLLRDAALAEPLPQDGQVFCWVGAESGVFQQIRDHWRDRCKLDMTRLLAAPYWKLGAVHSKEDEALGGPEAAHDHYDPVDADALLAGWEAHRAGNDRARSRDWAESQGVSEAHLIAAGAGRGTTRLTADWEDIIKGLPEVGRVMALTRNRWAVHEKIGTFGRIMWDDERPVVLDPDINLRIQLKSWAHGFAVEEQLADRVRHSLQVYDPYGVAVIKVYLQADADVQAFKDLVAVNRAEDQGRDVRIRKPLPAGPRKASGEVDPRQLEADWRAMGDTHDVFALSRRYGLSRVQTYSLVPEDLARRVDNDAFSRLLQTASADGEEVMIFVASPGNVQIHIGPVHKVERRGPWQNVLDPAFNLHLMEKGVASCWVITKPTMDGDITSIEIFDAEETQIAWVFGKRKPGNPQPESWRALVDKVCAPAAAVPA